jgi:hypothetical protein
MGAKRGKIKVVKEIRINEFKNYLYILKQELKN